MFQRSEEFLWRVRCWLHFITGRAEERLSFDLQRQVAAAIGYAGRSGQAPVERFMKAYFLVAKDVGDLTAIVCAALEARQQKPRASLSQPARLLRQAQARARARPSRLHACRASGSTSSIDDAFRRDPVNLLRLYEIASRDDLAIHPDASRLVTQSLRLVTPQLRNDPDANRIFLEILTARRSPEAVLRRMNESGLLGKFVPDFGRVVAMMQFNMYHHYTVDEHLIR
jgi:[protein-PII] uridylyltransferase